MTKHSNNNKELKDILSTSISGMLTHPQGNNNKELKAKDLQEFLQEKHW